MSTQKSLIDKCKIENVLKPKTNSQWQLFRGEEVAGSGTYHAMNNEGVVENVNNINIDDNIVASSDENNPTIIYVEYSRVTSSPPIGYLKIKPFSYLGEKHVIFNDTTSKVYVRWGNVGQAEIILPNQIVGLRASWENIYEQFGLGIRN